MSAAGLGGINGGTPPIATESDNAPGDNPMPARGVASPVSAAGAGRQTASRAGALPLAK